MRIGAPAGLLRQCRPRPAPRRSATRGDGGARVRCLRGVVSCVSGHGRLVSCACVVRSSAADLVVVLAQRRRRPHLERALAVEARPASARCGTGPSPGARPRPCSCRCCACGSSSASLVSYIGACGTSSRCRRRAPLVARPRARSARRAARSALPGCRCAPRAWRSAGPRTGRAARSPSARPCQNFSGDDMCSAIHLPSAHRSTYDCDTLGRLYGPITSPTWKKCVKASRLKCAIASSIDTSTVRPTPVRLRSNSAPSTP